MVNTESPVIFEIIEVGRKYRKELVFGPLLVGLVAWLSAPLLPKTYDHTLMMHVGMSPIAGAEFAEAVELAELKFMGPHQFPSGTAQVKSININRSKDAITSAKMALTGNSERALMECSQAIMEFVTLKLEPNWRVRRQEIQASVDEIEKQIATSTEALGELRGQIAVSKELTKSLTYRLAYDTLRKDIGTLRLERRETLNLLNDAGVQPMEFSQSDVQVLRFPKRNRLALSAVLAVFALISIGGYIKELASRVAIPVSVPA